ncbi:MAG: terminase [Caulobacteraceae bacterium]|nr:MAG: terminase [Caulobacteraceae bacterium]
MLDERRAAKFLYWSMWRISDIARLLKESEPTLSSWKRRDEWDKASPLERMEGVTEARYIALTMKAQKTGLDFKELDLLGRLAEKLARCRRYLQGDGHEGHINEKVANRNAAAKKRPERNRITGEQIELLETEFHKRLFGYQRTWWTKSDLRNRMILKSRQIGATYYFALEALIKALRTGHNQIFLSASKSQAHVFRGYIRAFVMEVLGIELSGDPIVIDRGEDPDTGRPLEQPTLYFLGTNARTAQGYHGDFYFDEFFWVFGFETLKKVASGMAMQKKYRKTYFSTPSSVTHEAYAFWTGDEWNRKRAKEKRREFDVSWAAVNAGAIGPDRIWRHMVTIEDAERQGCDLFDIEELREEYSGPEFENLLMCGFVDDTLSIFPMNMLTPCLVDPEDDWPDVDQVKIKLGGIRPYSGEVWLSYDPNGDGENADAAGLVVLAPPSMVLPGLPRAKFRVLERRQFKGSRFDEQAEVIRQYCKRYKVTKIDIDRTGLGNAVFQLVKVFFPNATGHLYDAALKTEMVYKALDVITKQRIQIPMRFYDLCQALMSIRRTTTRGGRAVTYEASRTKNSGHADLAWALMQSLINEPLEAAIGGARTSSVVIEDDDED